MWCHMFTYHPLVAPQSLLQHASSPAAGLGADGAAGGSASTLIGVVVERLASTLQRNSPAVVCAAARAAGE